MLNVLCCIIIRSLPDAEVNMVTSALLLAQANNNGRDNDDRQQPAFRLDVESSPLIHAQNGDNL